MPPCGRCPVRRQQPPAALHSVLSAATAAVALLLLLAPAANAQYQLQRVTTNTAAVILAQIPNTTSYIVSSRVPLDSGELAGFFDIGTQRGFSFFSADNHFCAGVGVDPNGNILIIGGERENMQMDDGRQSIARVDINLRRFGDAYLPRLATMHYPRWYPTPVRTDDSRFLVVGGTEEADAGDVAPVAELWDSLAPGDNAYHEGATQIVHFPKKFDSCRGRTYFPFMHLLPNGNIMWWGNRCGSITTNLKGNFKQIGILPDLPDNYAFNTMYPLTATISPLAYDPKKNYAAGMVIFGGGGQDFYEASRYSMRLDLAPCKKRAGYCPTPRYEQEDMGTPIVMGLSTLLPNGKIVLNGGAALGFAALINPENGYNYAAEPNMHAFIYDPEAPKGRRYTEFAQTNIMRLYHSTACLHITGEVLITGCETCDGSVGGQLYGVDLSDTAPSEHRIELLTPPYIAAGIERPTITGTPKVFNRGDTITVNYRYSGKITGAALAAPCADTHSINMGQRIIMLEMNQAAGNSLSIHAPPKNMPYLAPVGWYMLFLLGEDDTYSKGVWVQLQAKAK